MDGGVRTGSDVLKAVALGARAVLVARPYVWGLALGGDAGVTAVVRSLLADTDLTLAMCGSARSPRWTASCWSPRDAQANRDGRRANCRERMSGYLAQHERPEIRLRNTGPRPDQGGPASRRPVSGLPRTFQLSSGASRCSGTRANTTPPSRTWTVVAGRERLESRAARASVAAGQAAAAAG